MDYPADLAFDAPTTVANWRPLVHWLLAVPHYLILEVLSAVAAVVAVISWFAIMFTGALPPGLAGVQCMVIRYNARATSYALWMRERYPPFEFTAAAADPGGDPMQVWFRPATGERDRLTVGLRFLWILPAALFGLVLAIGVWVVGLASFFAVLFTGTYPPGMRDFMVRAGRYFVRLSAYGYLLTDDYPPFSLD